jgi:hypothetical protein
MTKWPKGNVCLFLESQVNCSLVKTNGMELGFAQLLHIHVRIIESAFKIRIFRKYKNIPKCTVLF